MKLSNHAIGYYSDPESTHPSSETPSSKGASGALAWAASWVTSPLGLTSPRSTAKRTQRSHPDDDDDPPSSRAQRSATKRTKRSRPDDDDDEGGGDDDDVKQPPSSRARRNCPRTEKLDKAACDLIIHKQFTNIQDLVRENEELRAEKASRDKRDEVISEDTDLVQLEDDAQYLESQVQKKDKQKKDCEGVVERDTEEKRKADEEVENLAERLLVAKRAQGKANKNLTGSKERLKKIGSDRNALQRKLIAKRASILVKKLGFENVSLEVVLLSITGSFDFWDIVAWKRDTELKMVQSISTEMEEKNEAFKMQFLDEAFMLKYGKDGKGGTKKVSFATGKLRNMGEEILRICDYFGVKVPPEYRDAPAITDYRRSQLGLRG